MGEGVPSNPGAMKCSRAGSGQWHGEGPGRSGQRWAEGEGTEEVAWGRAWVSIRDSRKARASGVCK